MTVVYFTNFVFLVSILILTIKIWRHESFSMVGLYFGALFLCMTLPKYIYIRFFWSDSAYLRVIFRHSSVDAIDFGFLLIGFFLTVLLFSYWYLLVYRNKRFGRIGSNIQIRPVFVNQDLSFLLLLPVSIAGFAFVVSYLNLGSSENLFQKIKLLNEDSGGGLLQYLLFKAAQFVKLIFYIYLVAIVSGYRQRFSFKIVAAISLVLSLSLYFLVSQRSGIFLILLDTLACFIVARRVNWKYVIYGLLLFMAANVLLLAGRLGSYELGTILESVFLRRYFFDVEKVSLIYEFAKSQCGSSLGLSDVFFLCFDFVYLGENIHLFVGEEIFGLPGLGVPPNIVGESILRFGTLSIIFIAPVVGLVLGKFEYSMLKSRSPLIKVALIIVIVRAIYFLSSSDLRGMVFRIVFDLTILFVGWYLYKFFGHIKIGRLVPAAQPR